jgi:hypothetical protein
MDVKDFSDKLELPADSDLNIEGKPNVPLCPMCTEVLENTERNYDYKRNNPDTRWFFCPECKCHLGFHRMKRKWKVSPYDLENNSVVREFFGLPPVEEPE